MKQVEDQTSRLDLYRPSLDDVPALFDICSDPLVWTHYPQLRHEKPNRTADVVCQWMSSWESSGLGPWVIHSKEDGGVLGYGGCAILGGGVWNLGYRLAVGAHGQGFATEVSRRAVARAAATGLGLPVIAYLLEHNHASAAVARKLGLALVDRGPDAGNPDPSAVRLIFADRSLTRSQLAIGRRWHLEPWAGAAPRREGSEARFGHSYVPLGADARATPTIRAAELADHANTLKRKSIR